MDMIYTAFRLAVRALMTYKARTLLTMLGIIIGIGSVIVMISVGRGANASIQAQIDNLGTNFLMIFGGSSKAGGVKAGYGTRPSLRVQDAEAIGRECPAVLYSSYLISRNVQLISGKENWGTKCWGASPSYFDVRNWPMKEGQPFTERHLRSASAVVVLGYTVAENLFEEDERVIGRRVRIKNFNFKVIGVLSSKGRTMSGNDQDDVVVVPYTTAVRKLFGRRLPGMVHFIGVSAHTKSLVPEAKREIEELLRQRHRIAPGSDDDFTIRTQDEYSAMATKTTGTMTLLLTAVAAVSLIVGGIGIMNIMLVSVTERTREIGIRIAVGARERDVLIQFLVESITLSVAGGLMGTVVGIAAAKVAARFGGWPTIISIDSILLATLFSGAVGIFFGFYPALKASRLDPIEALRYE